MSIEQNNGRGWIWHLRPTVRAALVASTDMYYRSILGTAIRRGRRVPCHGEKVREYSLTARKVTGMQGKAGRCGYCVAVDGVVKSPYGVMDFPKCKIHELLYEKFEKYGSRPALECSVTGRKYTYAKLRRHSGVLACSLQNKLKLDKGDTVAIFLPNLPEYPILFLAGSECGVILTTVNSSYKPEEVARQIEASGARAIFTTVVLYPVVETALEKLQRALPVVVIKETEDYPIPTGTINFMELLDPSTCGQPRKADVSHDDVAVLPYSSGTTGLPKGVQLMHRNITANILQMDDAKSRIGIGGECGLTTKGTGTASESVLGLLPMFHIYGMTVVTFSTLYMGGTLVTVPKFEPLPFLDLVSSRKVSTLYLVPPLILFLSNHPIVKAEYLKHVKFVINGASPIGQKDMEKLLEKGKHIIAGQGYGMTETSPVVLLFSKERGNKYGGTGVPVISTEVMITDPETLKPRPAEEIGEIWVRGPQVMKGYLNNQKATDEMIVDGWLRTGDLGYYDGDGDFFISDRMKDLIKVKGFQVAPAELEELLRTHPKITDAAVIGVPHDIKGEVPKAFVVLAKGKKATEEEIKDFIKGKVAAYKALDGGIVFVESIPKSAAGKILKKDLK